MIGSELRSGLVRLAREEMIDFSRIWDPLPIHLHDAVGVEAGFGGITASGTYLMAVKHRLIYDFNLQHSVIASFGYDEVRFHAPGQAGDQLYLRLRWIEKRISKSRPGTGIAKHHCELTREDGVVLLSLYDTILMRCRQDHAAHAP